MIDAYYDEFLIGKSTISTITARQLQTYINGIILQWNRFVDDTYEQASYSASPPNERMTKVWRSIVQQELDLHFYLICWDKVNKYFQLLSRLEQDPDISKALKKIRRTLHLVSRARGSYQHLDEELEAGRFGTRNYGFNANLGFTVGYSKTKHGKTMIGLSKIGPLEIQELRRAFEIVIGVLRQETKHT